jgi:catechol 2,3-dioxygenase-like lactoylglutathione lyase family enzyme
MITDIQHVALEVRDLGEAIAFYALLGLTPTDRPASFGDDGAWLAAGSAQLHLTVKENADAAETSQHVAFQVDDTDASVAELREHGVLIPDAFDIGAGRQAFLRDPSGNLIELNQPMRAC